MPAQRTLMDEQQTPAGIGPAERRVGLHAAAAQRVLDPCCGGRMMWFDRAHPDVVFGDRRTETLTVTDNSRGNASGTRTIRI